MKKSIIFSVCILLLISFISANAQTQMNNDTDAFASKKKKTYDLEIKYTKGMKFERTFKFKLNSEESNEDEDTGFQFDTVKETVNFLKTNITVLAVENDMPTELKIFFKKIKYVLNTRRRYQNEAKEAEKLVGHWIKIKKYDSKNFKITEKSDKYPEIDEELIDINEITKSAFYDKYNFKNKDIEIGDSVVFDYDGFILDEAYIEYINRLFKESEESREIKLKLEKVEKEGKSRIAYLKGKIKKSFTYDEAFPLTLEVEIKIELDITKHRYNKTCFESEFDIHISPMYEGVYSDNMKIKMQIDNDFSEEKQKDEVEKDDKKDDKD